MSDVILQHLQRKARLPSGFDSSMKVEGLSSSYLCCMQAQALRWFHSSPKMTVIARGPSRAVFETQILHLCFKNSRMTFKWYYYIWSLNFPYLIKGEILFGDSISLAWDQGNKVLGCVLNCLKSANRCQKHTSHAWDWHAVASHLQNIAWLDASQG